MHVGYQLSNILESIVPHNTEALYLCHNSIFDLFLSYCDIELNNYDINNKKFLDNNTRISSWSVDTLTKPYSIHIVNNPLTYLKNNNSIHFHLNTITFSHDIGLLSIKKEDAFLLCTNAFRPNDTLVYFNSIMSNYNCEKINRIKLEYAIPDEIQNLNQEKNGTAIFCYNKTVGPEFMANIGPDATQLVSLPNSLEELNNTLNKYSLFIELDPASIINCLTAVACGGIAVILDTNNILTEYRNIPNLYIINSLQELNQFILQKPIYRLETTIFDSRFRQFNSFKEKMSQIIKTSQRKAFVL